MNFIKKHSKGFIICLVIVCFIMIILSLVKREKPTFLEDLLSYVVVPVQKSTKSILDWSQDKVSFWKNIKLLEEENKRLQVENSELIYQIKRLEQVEKENDRLSGLLSIDKKYPDYEKVGARIIGKEVGNWSNTFIVDKGEKDGIEKNMVVISEGGLVGRVIESGLNYSKIMPIIDDTSAVSVKSLRTEDKGVLKGYLELSAKGLTRMEYIEIDAQIMEGDEIVTSNLSDIYPSGIAIGYVTEITPANSGLTKHAIVKPMVNFDNIETVLIITTLFKVDLVDN